MPRLFSVISIAFLFCFSAFSHAVTVQDSKGTFTLDYTPKRVVVLEFSFVDALASVNVSPVGIADDKKPNRVLQEVRDIIGEWTSVGTRSQPSLEVISSLKPDLIIADINRHEAIYEDLLKIAPTLIIKSRGETYEDNLKSAAIVGKVLGKDKEMQQRLTEHKSAMDAFSQQLPNDVEVQFAVARMDKLTAHSGEAYAGGVIRALGLKNPALTRSGKAYQTTSLEKLLAINPEYFILGAYSTPNIVDTWKNEPLWSALKISQNNTMHNVDGNTWSRCRGIIAAERMAQDLVAIFSK